MKSVPEAHGVFADEQLLSSSLIRGLFKARIQHPRRCVRRTSHAAEPQALNRKLFDVMTKGSGDARMQPLYFLITTAGTNRRDHREQGRRVRIHDAGKHDGLGERERPRHLHPHRDSQRDGLREDGLGSPQGFPRHQSQFQHLPDRRTPQAGGTFESRRRDRARREIHRRNQRHGAFLHRNLLSRKKGAPLGKAVLLLIT